MPKCSNMVSSVQSHDLGTIGALETAFLENRFSILARMRRVMRTHPLKDWHMMYNKGGFLFQKKTPEN